MKNKTIEEQVAELTDQQKETILNISKYASIPTWIISIAGIALCLIGLLVCITNFEIFLDNAVGYTVVCGLLFVILLGYVLFIKIKYPYYSDQKAKYLKKQHKSK